MREYMRAYRKTTGYRAYNRRAQKRWREDNHDKRKAQWTVNNAIRDGRLTRPTNCDRCNAEGKITAHHKDYSKPFEIEWLCLFCHADENMAARYE